MNKIFTIIAAALFVIGTITVQARQNDSYSRNYRNAPPQVHVTRAGTPDKRFKDDDATNMRTKKNGSRDMRYRQNRQPQNVTHKRKDGSPDMRYKDNKRRPARRTTGH